MSTEMISDLGRTVLWMACEVIVLAFLTIYLWEGIRRALDMSEAETKSRKKAIIYFRYLFFWLFIDEIQPRLLAAIGFFTRIIKDE